MHHRDVRLYIEGQCVYLHRVNEKYSFGIYMTVDIVVILRVKLG